MAEVFQFPLGAAVKVPLTSLAGTIIGRTEYAEAEPRYLIAWEDPAEGARENWWSENSVELA